MTTNDDIAMMKQYGITCEQNFIYRYRNYKYHNLQDAINFAKLYHEQAEENFILENEHPKVFKNLKHK